MVFVKFELIVVHSIADDHFVFGDWIDHLDIVRFTGFIVC